MMLQKTKLHLYSIFVCLLAIPSLQAASYTVAVNTQTLNGTTGSIDFQFNPGVGSFQSATASISGVTGGSYAGTQSIYGSGVSGGPVPSPINITNVGGQDNEVLDTYKFGTNLTFTLNLTGPAITSPNGSNTAGSTFAFFIFSDPAGLNPALTSDPNGIAFSVNVSTQGLLSPNIASPAVTLTPEPSTLTLFGAGSVLAIGLAFLLRARSAA